jgi:ABC-2 type transport system ATP-binding protein
VRDLSLSVPRGSIYGILGPNGAGKSTTLRMVMNIIARDSGTIEVLGVPPETRGVLRRVGYLPEERGLYRSMAVLDVIVFFGRLKGLPARECRREAVTWLERMGLADWRSARVDALSKGMQQKVQFITTVIHQPELLILDEPQSGLDPVNQEVLRETILAARAAGGTVVLSTHNMDQAEALCDAVCIIAGGSKVLDGAVRDVRRANRGSRYRLRIDPAASAASGVDELDRLLHDTAQSVTADSGRAVWDFELRDADPRPLLAAFARLQVELEAFERVEPSLHEIFIRQVGGSARRARRTEDGSV